MAGNRLRVVVFTSVPPRQVARIMAQLRRDAAEAQVVGVLYERRPPKNLRQRMAIWRKKMVLLKYWRYVFHRIFAAIESKLTGLMDAIIRFIHAAPKRLNGKPGFGLDDLAAACKTSETELFITPDIHSSEALDFVRRLNADLGLVFGTRILKPALFQIPKQGSINIHKRKVPDYRGGGAVGLWELLDGQKEIGVTVHRVEASVDVGAVIRSAVIPIHPFDNLESLALKANVVGADLIAAAIRDFANGTVTETPQSGPSKVFRSPSAEDLLQMKRKMAAQRPVDRNPFRRPAWKLLVKSLLYVVPVTLRNWRYRRRRDYPVMILYHHLVSDRPNHLGSSTVYFLRQVNYLLRHYRLVSVSEAVDLVRKGGVKVPTVAITFDDGYADNFINLRAITEETGIPIGYFISTEHLSTGREFAHDQSRDELGFLPNTWEQIETLRRCGYEIGSHTRNHADCGSTDEEFLRSEIIGSAEDIRQRLGTVTNFSFPFGLHENISAPAIQIACAHYKNVFSAYRCANYHSDARQILKRGNFSHTVWELELQLQSVLTPEEKEPERLKLRIDDHESRNPVAIENTWAS
jgi:folate-dependent phosphoribosylglycinamide formyltransferase PurN/peptidoglycan/xylan/chitin deacetylase (PgdA/CDA1 family)